MYDVIIIGGGPGGVSAGVYAARKQMKTLFITENFLSQSTVSASIENWIGTVTMPGFEFAKMLETHLRAQEGIEILIGVKAVSMTEQERRYTVTLSDGHVYETKAVIIATGGRHRHLEIPGEEKFIGKGVVFCSTCDAPFFRNKNVVVVGGGNAGLEAVEDLLPYASSVTLMIRSNVLRGDAVTQERIFSNEKVQTLYNAVPQEILGEAFVTGVLYKDAVTGEEKTLSADGIFVEIGMIPNTEFLKGVINLNERGEIILDHKTKSTSKPGVFAVGDATDAPYKQNNISAGDGVVAALSAYDYVKTYKA